MLEEAKKPKTKEKIDADDRDHKIKDISKRKGLKKTPEKRIPKVKEKLKPEKRPGEELVLEELDVDEQASDAADPGPTSSGGANQANKPSEPADPEVFANTETSATEHPFGTELTGLGDPNA